MKTLDQILKALVASSLSELTPAELVTDVWNALPGTTPVKRFESKDIAIKRIMAHVAGLGESPAPEAQPVAVGATEPAPKARTAKDEAQPASEPRKGTKVAEVIRMMKRQRGATIPEIMAETGWQHRHSVRGLISQLNGSSGKPKLVTTEKLARANGEMAYHIA